MGRVEENVWKTLSSILCTEKKMNETTWKKEPAIEVKHGG
jgi:hypothetical protein